MPCNQEGEIVVSTPSLFKGYWNKPEATAESIRNGWFHTGDIGIYDEDGYLHFLGRRKEMLKVRGMSVFPTEIESLLGRHPAILGSAVIGRADPEKGEVPVAFVTLRPDYEGDASPGTIHAWCREQMATYKVPEIRVAAELPVTATGKVKKHELHNLLEPQA
jgi:acyl-CoA synthetase (AMP-forming)/AMP-acid ligase II